MPFKNGIEVMQELKIFYDSLIIEYDQSLTPDLFIQQPIYILITSNHYNNNFLDYATKKGINYFFEKPLLEKT